MKIQNKKIKQNWKVGTLVNFMWRTWREKCWWDSDTRLYRRDSWWTVVKHSDRSRSQRTAKKRKLMRKRFVFNEEKKFKFLSFPFSVFYSFNCILVNQNTAQYK
jgi:hypothetical protein